MVQNVAIPARIWRPMRLATLVRLRWLAIIGQLVTILYVHMVLEFPLALIACLTLVFCSFALNLWLTFAMNAGYRLSDGLTAVQLAFDCLQLGGLLWLTGGLGNPFSLLLLAPVSVSATTLSKRATIFICALVALIVTILAISHLDLPWHIEAPLELQTLYLTGIWFSLLLGVLFIGSYTNRVAHEARQMADALTATELALSRQQQLSALDGLAAAAAHELGTPLSTIALAAKEMRAELEDGAIAEDADLIIGQVARCRDILAKLRNLESDSADPFDHVPLNELVAEVANIHDMPNKTIHISKGEQIGDEPVITRNVGLLYGLGNLIENAVHFAAARVEIEIGWNKSAFMVAITDDGDGFPPDLVTRLGEPYLTMRDRADESEPVLPGGLGLGIFIAKTLLERTGAELTLRNSRPNGAAQVIINWPADAEVRHPL